MMVVSTARLRTSTIRDLLKVTQQPDVISFAGGLPAPEHFPIEVIAECVREIMQEHGSKSLQYSVTEGIPEVREWVAERLTQRFGTSFEAADVISPNGAHRTSVPSRLSMPISRAISPSIPTSKA